MEVGQFQACHVARRCHVPERHLVVGFRCLVGEATETALSDNTFKRFGFETPGTSTSNTATPSARANQDDAHLHDNLDNGSPAFVSIQIAISSS
ncbi:hypothetical protein K443DRAFT_179621 [Laccaria amethystina LaAM-08-1]|uniref:Uncharacterized protein n=1 Tax=Laccaria amethystina LaAM-08-1 TaxID=1095629 RepID=A0A0C9XNJ9_9AGAR|nr:hypothetical protein K443DRAFT_179621 [Laccaria amethystina LaAM-08-1]